MESIVKGLYTRRERDGLIAYLDGDVVVSSADTEAGALRGVIVAERAHRRALSEFHRWAMAGPAGCPPYTSSIATALERLDATFHELLIAAEPWRD